MKELWSVLIEKLKLVEPMIATIIIGILGLFTIGMATTVIVKLFDVIAKIVELTANTGGSVHY